MPFINDWEQMDNCPSYEERKIAVCPPVQHGRLHSSHTQLVLPLLHSFMGFITNQKQVRFAKRVTRDTDMSTTLGLNTVLSGSHGRLNSFNSKPGCKLTESTTSHHQNKLTSTCQLA